jgi:hypothetical protein
LVSLQVASETGNAISDTLQHSVEQLAELHAHSGNGSAEDYISRAVEKLTFSMSDRAANEKKASRIISDWRRDKMGDAPTEAAKKQIEEFHCMAHVLRGFHTNSADALKEIQSELAVDGTKIGRDNLPVFNHWKKEVAASRAIRTTCETFGPAGDHLGLRDIWEAQCAATATKSIISNYRDNRFNNYFENAAQISHHRHEFLHILSSLNTDVNLKIKAVHADLKCPLVTTMLQALGLIYLLVTGPYRLLVDDSSVKYLELYRYIQPLHEYLQRCSEDPAPLMQGEYPFPQYTLPTYDLLHPSVSHPIDDSMNTIYHRCLCSISKACLKTVERQLVDILPDGKYSTAPSQSDIERTGFAPTTNLGCEHHFGDLDSSPKRRPNASMFLHSTIQILKRNNRQLKKWLYDMEESKRVALWKDAKMHGRELRQKHRDAEKREVNVILEKIKPKSGNEKKGKATKKSAKTNPKVSSAQKKALLAMEKLGTELEIAQKGVKVGGWVAVAYREDWFAGEYYFHLPELSQSVTG